MVISSTLTKLWHIMEEERNLIPKNDDEAAAGHNDIALLFEQTILQLGQTFNSLKAEHTINTYEQQYKGQRNSERINSGNG